MLIETECVRGRVFATRAVAYLALFEYIDGFYNRLGRPNPIEFEGKYYVGQATAEQANLNPRHPTPTS
ncbi:IS3 family transposase [Streptomyces sp. BE133]|uniref:IS3 family transposase n=1 Tax=Streptomyces sp. BE133 TaxID=3002523 RepID=UPI002E76D4B6|nr:IS3 family transposase [Streptomyces sp. BE133]MEE1811257.1 IS3 family transposase [Streptomyces sp. BE133]